MMIKMLKNDTSNKFYYKIPLAKFAPPRGIGPINLFISVKHVPMDVDTDISKKEKKLFKMWF